MTPISRATWALLLATVGVAGACVWALIDLGQAPWTTAPVPVPGHRLFVSSSDDGLSVLTDRSSFRVLPDLRVVERAWPEELRVRSVDSAATNGDFSLFIVGARGPIAAHCHCDQQPPQPPRQLLYVDRESVRLLPTERAATLLGVRARGAHLELWRLAPSSSAQTPASDPVLAAAGIEEHWVTTTLPPTAVEGIVFEGSDPLLVVSHKRAHWLVDAQGALRPMPGSALSLWTPSFLRPPSSTPWREPFVDDQMAVFAFVPGSSALAFTIGSASELDPLIVTHGDEPGVFASTSASGDHVEVKHIRRRVWVRQGAPDRWVPLAISTSTADFVAYPVGPGWIALSETPATGVNSDEELGEAIAFDDRLNRIDRGGLSSVSTLAGAGQAVWVGLTALLLLSLALLPLVVIRLRRRFLVDEDDVYVGFLRAAPGAVVSTDGTGRAVFDGGTCELASPRGVFELTRAPLRIDEGSGRPLIDGDAVYLVGRPENGINDAGPWRAAQRARLATAGELYLIGRGGRQELARNVAQIFNRRLALLVVAQLAAGIVLFSLIHVRTFF